MLPRTLRLWLDVLALSAAAVGAVGCGDDTDSPGGSGTTTATTTSSSGGGGGLGGSGGAGGSGGSGGEGGAGGGAVLELDALVRGPLAAADLAAAKAQHDALASGGEPSAKALGDFGHAAMLGTTLFGTTENEFLALDRWSTENMDQIYGDPGFQQAFGALFAAPPTFEKFRRRFTWHGWGDLTSGDAFPQHWFVVVRGRLAAADEATSQATHDALASGGEQAATAAGDVAHVAFLGRDDAREFLAIDVWQSADNIEAVYGDPAFQQGFASLFEATPTLGVYVSTDWHQW